MRVTTATLLCAALAVGAYGSQAQPPAMDSFDPRCRTLDTACQDIWIASQCRVTKRCIPRWEMLPTSTVGNDTELCATCKKMVQEAKDQLLSKETQAELRQVLEGSCDILLPIEPLKGLCKKLMDEFQDEVNDMLVSRMDPVQVCTVSGLCWTSAQKTDLFERVSYMMLSKDNQKAKCEACKSTVEKAISFTKFIPKDTIVEAFAKNCEMGTENEKAKCLQFTHTYVDKFFETLRSATPERTCQALERCSGDVTPMPSPATLGLPEDLQCEFCEAMVHKFSAEFNNTSMKSQVKTVLENVCKHTRWAQECLDKVKADFDKAYDELIDLLNPPVVCKLLGLCTASVETVPLAKLVKASEPSILPMARLTHAVSHPSMLSVKKLVKTKGEVCEVCQMITGYIVRAINNDTTKDNVEAVLEQVCLIVPMDVAECQQFIDRHVDKIYELLRKEVTVDHICRGLHLCDLPTLGRKAAAARRCSVCTRIAEWIDHELKRNKSQTTILTNPEKMCSLMPEEDRSQCENIMDFDVRLIHTLVLLNLTSTEKCYTTGMCPAPRRKDTECALCTTITSWILDDVKNEKTNATILTAMEKVCGIIPINAGQCKNIIDEYGEKLFDYIKQDMNAEEICTALKLCGPAFPVMLTDQTAINTLFFSWLMDEVKGNETDAAIEAARKKACTVLPIDAKLCQEILKNSCGLSVRCPPKPAAAPKKKLGSNCELCTLVTDWILDEIKDDKSEASILAAVEKVCTVIPVDGTECKNIIDTYGGILIKYIKEDLSAGQICKLMGLCATPAPTKLNDNCVLCDMVASWLVNDLKDNKTDAAILAGFEKVCKALPVDGVQCKNIIDTYGGMLITVIQENLSPDLICKTIGLCAVPKPARQTPKVMRPGDWCETCTVVATWLVNEVKDDKTDAAILAALEKVCDAVPMNPRECKNYIDTYGEVLIELLKNDLSAEEICSAIGVCAIPRLKKLGDNCYICTLVATYLVDELKDNKTDGAIVQKLEKVCSVIPIDGTACKNYVDTYSLQLIQFIQNNLTAEQICSALGLCSTRRVSVQRQRGGDICAMCEIAADWLVKEVTNNKTEASILTALENVCKVIPVDKTECQNMIDTYGGMLFQLLQEEVTPAEICAAVGLCLVQPRPTKNIPGGCTLCTTVANWVLAAIRDNKTEQAIIAALDKVCSVLPTNNAGECRFYVDTYGDQLIKLFAEDLTAQGICTTINLCSSRAPRRVGDSQACSMCQIVVNVVEAEVKNNNTQTEIIVILDNVCSLMPTKDRTTCRNMINVYTAYIIELLESFASPEEICQTLGFCPTPPVTPKCEICMFITSVIEYQLSANQTETEILKVLDKVCDNLPGMNVPQCKATVEQFTDMIITLLVKMVPPRKICEEIRQCPIPSRRMTAVSVSTMRAGQVKDEKCSLCKWLVTWVDNKLTDNRTEAVIKEELDKACDLLSDSSQCRQMVDDYVDMIIEMLIQYVEPEKICEALGKCPKKSVQLRGDEPPCQLCKYYVEELRNRLSNRSTEDEIKNELYHLCSALPVNSHECTALVDRYTDALIKLVLENTKPETVCQILRACPKRIVVQPKATSCDFCQLVMNFISVEIRDEDNDARIVEVVEKVCDLVPEIHRNDCYRMVEIEGMIIVRMVAESVDPKSICEAIKFCPTTGANVVCTWCDYALHFVQEKLYDNATQSEIQSQLDMMCARIKNPFVAKDCKEFVDFYGRSLEVIIAQELDPSIVCPAIHACPPSRVGLKGRRPSSLRCHDCISSLKAFRRNPQAVCDGANAQFFEKCVAATSTVGIGILDVMGSDYKTCKLAKACTEFNGSFSCNRGGCQHVA